MEIMESFIQRSLWVLRVSYRPKSDEFWMIAKITGLGMMLIGDSDELQHELQIVPLGISCELGSVVQADIDHAVHTCFLKVLGCLGIDYACVNEDL